MRSDRRTRVAVGDEAAVRASVAYPMAESIGYLVGLTNRKLQPMLEHLVADEGISYGTWFYLRVLWEEDGIGQGELARRVNTAVPTTIAALRKLSAAGFVELHDDPDDGRRVTVRLTKKGRGMEKVLLPRLAELNQRLLAGMTPHEVAELRRLLRVIQANTASRPE